MAYESRVLENSEVNYIHHKSSEGTVFIRTNESILIDTLDTASGTVGVLYTRVGGDVTINPLTYTSFPLVSNSSWIVGYVLTTPIHSTIALDNSTSSASKYFYALEEGDNGVLAGVYGEEITYDGVSEWGDTDFSQLTNGTIPDVNGGSDVKTFHGVVAINGRIK